MSQTFTNPIVVFTFFIAFNRKQLTTNVEFSKHHKYIEKHRMLC